MKPKYFEYTLEGNAQQFDIEVLSLLRAAGAEGTQSQYALNSETLENLSIELYRRGVTGKEVLTADNTQPNYYVLNDEICSVIVSGLELGSYNISVSARYGTYKKVLCVIFFDVVTESGQGEPIEIELPVVSGITEGMPDLTWVAKEETSQEIKTALSGQALDIERIALAVQAIKDAHILGFSYDGIIFETGYEPRSAFGIIAERDRIVEIHDESDDYIPSMEASDYPELEVLELKSAYYAYSNRLLSFLENSLSIREVSIPKFNESAYGENTLKGCTNLRKLNILNWNVKARWPGQQFLTNTIRLIDIIYGKGLLQSTTALELWSPTEALLADSTSLLTQEDLDAGFTSNHEKLLYNIREHIAANLNPNITATITFSAAIYAAIQADQDTVDAFPASWTIASA